MSDNAQTVQNPEVPNFDKTEAGLDPSGRSYNFTVTTGDPQETDVYVEVFLGISDLEDEVYTLDLSSFNHDGWSYELAASVPPDLAAHKFVSPLSLLSLDLVDVHAVVDNLYRIVEQESLTLRPDLNPAHSTVDVLFDTVQ